MKPNSETILCASVANPNRSTKSPVMHNAAFEALGLNYVYLAFEPIDLKGTIIGMRALGIRGFSVSKPYKEKVIPLLDTIDAKAKKIGAVNTVLNTGSQLIGYNSDWIGAVEAIKEKVKISGKKIVIVGAGGAARAIAFGIKNEGGNVTLYNRNEERGKTLAKELKVKFGGGIEKLSNSDQFDILINATSVGFFPSVDETIIPTSILSSGKLVLDIVFNPAITKLMRDAEKAGCIVVSGLRMLVLQGAFQFRLFTGIEPPLDVMQASLEQALERR